MPQRHAALRLWHGTMQDMQIARTDGRHAHLDDGFMRMLDHRNFLLYEPDLRSVIPHGCLHLPHQDHLLRLAPLL